MKTTIISTTQRASAIALASAALLTAGAPLAQAQQPPGCLNGGMASVITVSPTIAHIGDIINITQLGVALGGTSCNVTNGQSFVMYPDGVVANVQQYETNFTITQGDTLTCLPTPSSPAAACNPVTLTYVVQAADMNRNLLFTTPRGFTSGFVPGTPKQIKFLVVSDGLLVGSDGTLTAGGQGNAAVQIISPSIACQKFCSNGVGENGIITFSGFVTNTGDTALFNVTVSNLVNGVTTLVTNIAQLNVGEAVAFAGSYAPADPCVPTPDTIFVRGLDVTGFAVSSQCSATCSNVITPCIVVTKDCNTVVVGQPNTISGSVTNCGNVTITNINITDNLYGFVTNVATLAPGASVSYSRLVTNSVCGNFTNIVTAAGTTRCGQPVSDTDTDVCIVVANPCLVVTKDCDTVVIGQPNTISGVVTNCGDVTITNITISDNLYGFVATIPSLAPGASAAYNKLVTNSVCGNYTNVVTAAGTSVCGQPVNDTDTDVCVVVENPCIQVTKNCDTVVLGQGNLVSGTVTNCGNVTLTNISIVDNLYGTMASGVTLAPGGSQNYSRFVTNTVCGNFTNIVTATGRSTCGTQVIANATNVCVVTSLPCIAVTKNCDTVVLGQGNLVSGTVTNCGNITLTNISIVDNLYGTMASGITLLPGASQNYSRFVTNTVCGNFTNIVTATGRSTCGDQVIANATNVCVVVENPCIQVTKNCDTVVLGQGNLVSGTVTNCGNVTLTNISIVDNLYGTMASGITLAPGGSQNYSRFVTNTVCGNFTNIVTATGRSVCGTQVIANATNVCVVVENPCIQVSKNCDTVLIGLPNTVSGVVTNCGNVTLTNITIVDNLYGTLATIPSLAPNTSANYLRLVTNNTCGDFTNVVVATGRSVCGTQVSANATNVCHVLCLPDICVTKEVVCELPSGCDTNWSHFAQAARAIQDNQCPVFCYRITVENCGQELLTNVVVVDNVINAEVQAQCSFPTTLAVGQSYSCVVTGIVHCVDTTNTVTATGVGFFSGIPTNATDTAAVAVQEIDIVCRATVNGENFITIPCDGAPHLVTNAVEICNTGDLPLGNISIYAPYISALGGDCASFTNLLLSLDPGQCTNLVLCVDAVTCPTDCTIAFSNYVKITATIDLTKTNVCAWTFGSSNEIRAISITTECEAVVGCERPNACRTTGGGRQDDPLAYPHNVRYVTHGGQVGAPVGNKVCDVDVQNFPLGNPCIHGRWTHVRHMKGGLRGNFHARYYDTLDCACLDTNLMATNYVVVGPAGTQSYVNWVYGPGTVTGGVCNADDHKIAGPQPRPAPANKIVFTGVGDWADPNGRRAPRAVLFRVDLEDRSEPGGSHPKGGKAPPDRYRIRIWVLSTAELAQLRGGGADPYLNNFRDAIAACNGLNVQDGASVPNGAPAFGVRAPDIDDGGELERGNHQIHPSIKSCDPFNPTGPGLPPKLPGE